MVTKEKTNVQYPIENVEFSRKEDADAVSLVMDVMDKMQYSDCEGGASMGKTK